MIIPIRCFTCNKVIADIYDYYLKECEKYKTNNPEKNDTKEILDKLGVSRYCCRRHLISTVDMMKII
jgi:DNA-directed RNA polymerase I, II, and III subunit RPABC5